MGVSRVNVEYRYSTPSWTKWDCRVEKENYSFAKPRVHPITNSCYMGLTANSGHLILQNVKKYSQMAIDQFVVYKKTEVRFS